MYLHEHPRRLGSRQPWLVAFPFIFVTLVMFFLCEKITRTVTREKPNFSLRPTAEAGGRGSRPTHVARYSPGRRTGEQLVKKFDSSCCSSSLDRNFLSQTQEKRLMSIASLVECFVSKTDGCGRLFHDIFHRFVWPRNDQSLSCDPLIVAHRQTIAATEEMTVDDLVKGFISLIAAIYFLSTDR